MAWYWILSIIVGGLAALFVALMIGAWFGFRIGAKMGVLRSQALNVAREAAPKNRKWGDAKAAKPEAKAP